MYHNCQIVNLRFVRVCCGGMVFFIFWMVTCIVCDSTIFIVELSIFVTGMSTYACVFFIINRPCGRTGRYRKKPATLPRTNRDRKKRRQKNGTIKKVYPINTNNFFISFNSMFQRGNQPLLEVDNFGLSLMTFGFIRFSQFRCDCSARSVCSM